MGGYLELSWRIYSYSCGTNKTIYPFLLTIISSQWHICARKLPELLHLLCNMHTIQLVTTTGKFKVFSASGFATPFTWPVRPPSDSSFILTRAQRYSHMYYSCMDACTNKNACPKAHMHRRRQV